MQLKAVEKTSLVEAVEQKILDTVRKNNLSIGDSLLVNSNLLKDLVSAEVSCVKPSVA